MMSLRGAERRSNLDRADSAGPRLLRCARNDSLEILGVLAARQRVPHRVMVVAAHPDDETIGLGAQLCRFGDLILVHVTDGAPRDGKDAANYGFASIAEYAAARRKELDDALATGEVTARRCHLDIADQQAHRELADLTRRIVDLLDQERPEAVIAHAYEGGHPDHDSAAFAVHAACALVADAPAIIEMALYHRANGTRVSGELLPAPPPSESPSPAMLERVAAGDSPRTDESDAGQQALTRLRPSASAALSRSAGEGQESRAKLQSEIALDKGERERKQRMVDAFATQRWLLMQLETGIERLRIAPEYDFRRPPHPGRLHYETLGWDITGAEWCRHATAALAQLGFDHRECL